jgi:ATP-dependent exoDNAse (exonuclease V) beta subunit
LHVHATKGLNYKHVTIVNDDSSPVSHHRNRFIIQATRYSLNATLTPSGLSEIEKERGRERRRERERKREGEERERERESEK